MNKRKAYDKETISYTELFRMMGNGSPRTIGNRIGDISTKCNQKNYPLISVKVVSNTTGKPSRGFWGLYQTLNLASEEEIRNRKLKRQFLAIENTRVEEFTNWGELLKYLEQE